MLPLQRPRPACHKRRAFSTRQITVARLRWRSFASHIAANTGGQLTKEELEKLTVVELKTNLRQRGLPVSGLKAVLVSRLLQDGQTETTTQHIADPENSQGELTAAVANLTSQLDGTSASLQFASPPVNAQPEGHLPTDTTERRSALLDSWVLGNAEDAEDPSASASIGPLLQQLGPEATPEDKNALQISSLLGSLRSLRDAQAQGMADEGEEAEEDELEGEDWVWWTAAGVRERDSATGSAVSGALQGTAPPADTPGTQGPAEGLRGLAAAREATGRNWAEQLLAAATQEGQQPSGEATAAQLPSAAQHSAATAPAPAGDAYSGANAQGEQLQAAQQHEPSASPSAAITGGGSPQGQVHQGSRKPYPNQRDFLAEATTSGPAADPAALTAGPGARHNNARAPLSGQDNPNAAKQGTSKGPDTGRQGGGGSVTAAPDTRTAGAGGRPPQQAADSVSRLDRQQGGNPVGTPKPSASRFRKGRL